MRTEQAILAGGCFWCLEAVYQEMRGVVSVESGYTGGRVPEPTYRQVCGGETGHTEAVRVTFDADAVSYAEILDVFFAIHDPTSRDRQGNDVGPQYRSAIFYVDESQRKQAEDAIRELNAAGVWPDPIVTEVRPAGPFYPAEEYHRDYFRNNPGQPYCAFVIAPKVKKFREKFK